MNFSHIHACWSYNRLRVSIVVVVQDGWCCHTGTNYDPEGNLLNDTFHTYSWDADGNSVKIDSINATYDALDRMVELTC
jgi:YD repeat-containing protein